MFRLFRSKIYLALAMILFVLLVGVFGYRYFAGFNWTDALYMTVITITTVGFSEVEPMGPLGKIFTMVLILISVIALGYAISIITEFLLSRSNYELLKRKKVQKKVDQLENHVIIVGYGRNGKQAAQKLLSYEKPFVVIEMEEDVISRYETEDFPFIQGNANEDEVLIQAGVERAACVICALPSDANNLFVVLSARQLNANLKIISRASEETTYQKLKLAGADNVIMPDRIGGEHMASLVVVPDLVEFLDNIAVTDGGNPNVQEIPYINVCPDRKDRSIIDIDLRRRTGCTIIGYKSPTGEYLINPEASLVIEEGSKLIVIGRPDQIAALEKEFRI
ncbi:potassium channel protein [Flavobacteriaceae bacterium YJPT1-3]|nr:potassium channel protein [Flavobacteriaceae bacterium YJPT1-3]